jgi:eukaryotic-like serine/threonine-protein kinase
MSSNPPPPPVPIGELVAGKYRIERIIGQGGMGVVVAAMHEQLGQRVAIKMLLQEAKASPNAIARFMREARAAASIRGEHVARVLDVGELDGGAPYIVMEYLEGRDLSETLSKDGPLPVEEAVAFVLQACEAIAEAHAAGIIHRDLKPSNLFVTAGPDGTPLVKVLDFGISKALLTSGSGSGSENKLTTTSSFVGSPVYSPPEQLVQSSDVDARADIWSIGTILFEALAGRAPFVGDSVMHVASRIFNEAPTPLSELRPDLPPELSAVVMRCLRKRREERYSDVSELALALAPFAPGHSVSAERIARIVAASLPGSRVAAALADTQHDAKAPSGDTPHALVSAQTPPPAGSRRRTLLALAGLVAGTVLVAVLAVGRNNSESPAHLVPVAPSVVPQAAAVTLVEPSPPPPSATASVAVPTVEAASPAPSASPSVTTHVTAPAPTKRNPLSVGVK